MLLLKSDVEVDGNEVNIKMRIRGADFLKAKKTDKELEKVLKNLFGKEYKVNLQEQLSKEEMEEIREEIKQVEEKVIAHIEELNAEKQRENANNENHNEYGNVPEYNDPDYVPPTDMEGYIPEEAMDGIPLVEGIENFQEQEYIMGKPSKAKENKVADKRYHSK